MNPLTVNDRLDSVDALRGFALAGILIAHMLEQFIASPRPAEGWMVESTMIDKIIQGGGFIFISAKFFSIFSLLFGMSFTIMMQRASHRGHSFSGRFVWRLAILLMFGFVHTLIYRGDILSVYASLGLLLPLAYHLSDRWLLILAAALFLGLGRYLFYVTTGTTTLLDYHLSPETPEVIEYVALLKNGGFWDVVQQNLSHGFANKFDFQYSVYGRGYVTFGYFLVGIWLVRQGFFHNLEAKRGVLKKTLLWSLAVLVLSVVAMITSFSLLPKPINNNSWGFVVSVTFYDLTSIAMTSIWVCAFLLLYLGKPHRVLSQLAPYGRMALTHYLLQSLIGTFIFYGWGLGMVGELHDWQTLLLAIGLIAGQLVLTRFWLARFRFGPLEWLWRCATYFRVTPIRNESNIQTVGG